MLSIRRTNIGKYKSLREVLLKIDALHVGLPDPGDQGPAILRNAGSYLTIVRTKRRTRCEFFRLITSIFCRLTYAVYFCLGRLHTVD